MGDPTGHRQFQGDDVRPTSAPIKRAWRFSTIASFSLVLGDANMTVELDVESIFDYTEGPDVLTCPEQPCSSRRGEQPLSPFSSSSSSSSSEGELALGSKRRARLLPGSSDDEKTPSSSKLEGKEKTEVSGTENWWLYACITCRPLQLNVAKMKLCTCVLVGIIYIYIGLCSHCLGFVYSEPVVHDSQCSSRVSECCLRTGATRQVPPKGQRQKRQKS